MDATQISTLKEQLHTGFVQVTFTKKDGSTRVMKCTLQESFLPKAEANTLPLVVKTQKAESSDSLAVWDLEANGWRAFRFDSVTDYQLAAVL